MVDLPWSNMTNDRLDISQARSGTLQNLVFKNKISSYNSHNDHNNNKMTIYTAP